jgi:hypothetical protein
MRQMVRVHRENKQRPPVLNASQPTMCKNQRRRLSCVHILTQVATTGGKKKNPEKSKDGLTT